MGARHSSAVPVPRAEQLTYVDVDDAVRQTYGYATSERHPDGSA
jgi:hypothetical protein